MSRKKKADMGFLAGGLEAIKHSGGQVAEAVRNTVLKWTFDIPKPIGTVRDIIAGYGKLVNSSYGNAGRKILGLTLICLLMYFSSFHSIHHQHTGIVKRTRTVRYYVVCNS
ncbi:MAG: hypothetical protein KQI62_21505 [Deltaproteobacteria bacterium]|nr:hypothetical protein [Deltaproteobacteria bacterium]